MKIENLFSKHIKYEGFKKRIPNCSLMRTTDYDEYKSRINTYKRETNRFEKRVFIHLFENRNNLGIEKIYLLKNMLVDGLLKLDRGDVILLEIKYALNWKTSCIARIQIQRFFEQKFDYKRICEYIPEKQPERALVIFDHFSADWKGKQRSTNLQFGWLNFYEEEEILKGKFPIIPMDIVQLIGKGLKGAP